MKNRLINRKNIAIAISLIVCMHYTYSQDCSNGFTYFDVLPETVTIQDENYCLSDIDLNALNDIIIENGLNYNSEIEVGVQTWNTGRLKLLVARYNPNGSGGVNAQLTILPESFGDLTELFSLFLEWNNLTYLPDSFSQLTNLFSLTINNNWLTNLPEDFGNISNLWFLDLGYNQLTSFPQSVCNMTNLDYLYLFNNNLTSLPECICTLDINWNDLDGGGFPYFASGDNYLCDNVSGYNVPSCINNTNYFESTLDQFYYSAILYAPQDCPVEYTNEIQPIFNNKCTSCHSGTDAEEDLSLTSYNNVMNGGDSGDVVIPYDHANSLLWQYINSGFMPPGNDDLTIEEVNLIAEWIDEGALGMPISGCTDPAAYNCSDDDSWTNYIFDIGGTMYDNSCNWDWNLDTDEADYIGGCESGPCEGYYNPGATTDDGSCRYYQAPHGNQVVFTLENNGITVNWSTFTPPLNAVLESYHVQRCVETCTWLPGFTLVDSNNETSLFDVYDYEAGIEIKYAIAVKYSNNPYWGWAIGASYITPEGCNDLGDFNGDGNWNVLDVVQLANCVLAQSCLELDIGCAGDLNGDGNYNVLDVVILANCVLSNSCGD